MITPLMAKALRRIYGLPASVTMVTGLWKHGKTDFALRSTEWTKELGVLSSFASNIETQDSEIKFINNFPALDYWLFSNSQRKAYLYDEVVESSPKRKAMTSLNIKWVQRVPQLSKAKCHLIVISQEENLADSIFLNRTFFRGMWRKMGLKQVTLDRSLFRNTLRWRNIPKTNIKFDPYLLATFKEAGVEMTFQRLIKEQKVMYHYGQGLTLEKISHEVGLKDKVEALRALRRICKAVSVAWLQLPSEGERVAKVCNTIND